MMDIDLDRVKIETELPIIARIKDDLYPYEGYDHIRQTARAIIWNPAAAVLKRVKESMKPC